MPNDKATITVKIRPVIVCQSARYMEHEGPAGPMKCDSADRRKCHEPHLCCFQCGLLFPGPSDFPIGAEEEPTSCGLPTVAAWPCDLARKAHAAGLTVIPPDQLTIKIEDALKRKEGAEGGQENGPEGE